ncbi:MAG: NAD-dependent epimerase/dehydratase family protein [Alphaproteobacteria bacterium]|nr:NAD-dependent epimerase/dehydratase family protein [Alphaproteobacteria bacterium]
MRALVTGSAGFIGFHLCRRLLAEGYEVTGFDAMTAYYDPRLKEARLAALGTSGRFTQIIGKLEDSDALLRATETAVPDVIVHLAAQAGVRYSFENPRAYVDSNLVGSWSLLEAARQVKPKHLMLASTSSIYGANPKVPFAESDKADEPLSLYAATKKGMEAMAHAYAHLHEIPTTAFRFFTVYGPWGRPDMALFKFTKAILAGEPIEVYGGGQMRRDFTFVEDLVEAIMRLAPLAPARSERLAVPYQVVNIGGGQPVGLIDFIETLEAALGKPSIRKLLPMQPGDVPQTYAAPDVLVSLTGYKPTTPLRDGVRAFVDWYRSYYGT